VPARQQVRLSEGRLEHLDEVLDLFSIKALSPGDDDPLDILEVAWPTGEDLHHH
jgi:hypothetical protein